MGAGMGAGGEKGLRVEEATMWRVFDPRKYEKIPSVGKLTDVFILKVHTPWMQQISLITTHRYLMSTTRCYEKKLQSSSLLAKVTSNTYS